MLSGEEEVFNVVCTWGYRLGGGWTGMGRRRRGGGGDLGSRVQNALTVV